MKGTSPQTKQLPPSRSALLLDCARKFASSGNTVPVLHIPSPPDAPASVDDLALVLCHHGTAPERIRAAKEALALTLASRPAPAEVILVEAQKEGVPCVFAGLPGVTHIPRVIPKAGEGCWLKEALWTVGAAKALENPAVTKLCFLDIDVSFADGTWATAVSDSLDPNDLISPHSHLYYADQPDAASGGLCPSTGHTVSTGASGCGQPGIAVAMTREFFLKRLKGRLTNICVGSGDVYLWLTAAGIRRYPASPEFFAHALTRTETGGLTPAPRIGCANQLACHHYHGPFTDRCYRERVVLSRACSSATGEAFTYNADGMPVWKDTPGGRILSRAYPELLANAKAGRKPSCRDARERYDRLALTEYGPIDAAHPFIVVCLLKSGGIYTPRHVQWLKAQFDAHCNAPFRFVCQSDVDIPGIETIPLVLDAPAWWGQVEHYRALWPANATVLTCDLDTVLFNDFTPHRCPPGEFFMLREYGNWVHSKWAVWGGGLTCFSGDFSFIPDAFQRDLSAGGRQSPLYSCIAPQEFTTSCLRAKGIFPGDIAAHFAVSYYQGTSDSIHPDAHFAVFPGTPKPWDITPRPYWIPALP